MWLKGSKASPSVPRGRFGPLARMSQSFATNAKSGWEIVNDRPSSMHTRTGWTCAFEIKVFNCSSLMGQNCARRGVMSSTRHNRSILFARMAHLRRQLEFTRMRGGEISENLAGDNVKTLPPRERRVVAGLATQIHFRHAALRRHVFFQQLKITNCFVDIIPALAPIKMHRLVRGIKIAAMFGQFGVTDGKPRQPQRPFRSLVATGNQTLAAINVTGITAHAPLADEMRLDVVKQDFFRVEIHDVVRPDETQLRHVIRAALRLARQDARQ